MSEETMKITFQLSYTVTVHQSLVESLWEKGSDKLAFLQCCLSSLRKRKSTPKQEPRTRWLLLLHNKGKPKPKLPPLPHSLHKQEPQKGIPDRFDGTWGMKSEVYAIQVSLYITKNMTRVPENKSKVFFSLVYLMGQASQCR
ncbi:uncharacterized protein VP01_3g6 [Puccinia sorghi]|uniref:Uncharacterized protein n=1 Tax=Puccinia sorghi TaxID=27349 RepID=A0A0L6UTX6_9BASI|nr:uncharacterized protein VP01_3g6 [Puccinia sorghi]